MIDFMKSEYTGVGFWAGQEALAATILIGVVRSRALFSASDGKITQSRVISVRFRAQYSGFNVGKQNTDSQLHMRLIETEFILVALLKTAIKRRFPAHITIS
jgi:hypothetical protein